jgi:hypothetical protein
MFLLGLHLADKLLEAPLPGEVKRRCEADKRLVPLAANIVAHLFSGPEHVPATSREVFKFNLGVRKSFRARTRYLVHMLQPTDGDISSQSLPAFAYYLKRPFRLLFRSGNH